MIVRRQNGLWWWTTGCHQMSVNGITLKGALLKVGILCWRCTHLSVLKGSLLTWSRSIVDDCMAAFRRCRQNVARYLSVEHAYWTTMSIWWQR